MEILVVHHVEKMWGEITEKTAEDVYMHLRQSDYDKVIFTTLEGDGTGYAFLDEMRDGARFVEEVWGYGWENPDYYRTGDELDEKFADKLIPVTSPHEWAYVYEWIEQLSGHTVSVCGGYKGECFLDLVETMDFLGIKYKKLEGMIYGE